MTAFWLLPNWIFSLLYCFIVIIVVTILSFNCKYKTNSNSNIRSKENLTIEDKKEIKSREEKENLKSNEKKTKKTPLRTLPDVLLMDAMKNCNNTSNGFQNVKISQDIQDFSICTDKMFIKAPPKGNVSKELKNDSNIVKKGKTIDGVKDDKLYIDLAQLKDVNNNF
uniref:Uncharacterized protein n=1 Tax=Strongyloides stercoralis TaxID=6248 RepID=A0A0K0E3Y1_STRER